MKVHELNEKLSHLPPDAVVTLTCEGATYPLLLVAMYELDCDLGGGWSPLKETNQSGS